jgi:membrane protein DedA with SNARE-associated domain
VGGSRGVFVSLIEYAQRHYSFLLLLVFLLTFSKSCALISLLVPGTSGLLLLGPLASGSLNHFLFMWLSASLGAIGGFWISWWLGRHYQHRLLRLRWLRGDRLARSLTFLHRHGEWAVFFGRFLSPLRATLPGQRRQRHAVLAFSTGQCQLGTSLAAASAGSRCLQLQFLVKYIVF